MSGIFTVENLLAFLTLTAMEVVLGIDNIVFLSIVTGRLPPAQQPRARRIGLILAMGLRIGLLFAITWIMGLGATLFAVLGHGFSGRDLILLAGGAFLMGKATFEIHDKLEGPGSRRAVVPPVPSLRAAVIQIMLLDLVFSLDSVITAVGMAQHLWVMVAAVVVAVLAMMVYAGAVAAFIERHPTMKMLALSFLLLIGVVLVADGLGQHVEKGYIYFAMAFSLLVELLNVRLLKKHPPVHLRHPEPEPGTGRQS